MFSTIEISDDSLTPSGLRFVTVKSPALKRRANLTVWSPAGVDGASLPLVILLHGVYGSHWAWAFKGDAHGTAARMIAAGEIPPLALAMPSDGLWGDGSAYVTHADADYERWIVDEVPAAAAAALNCVSLDSPMAIAGLSMGGYGAMRLGCKYPDRFVAISAHSSVTRLDEITSFVAEPRSAFPEPDFPDVADAALRCDNLPPLRFDCGRDDALIEGNRTLHRRLTEAGVPHEYNEFDGAHTWDYWRAHLADSLRFIGKYIPANR